MVVSYNPITVLRFNRTSIIVSFSNTNLLICNTLFPKLYICLLVCFNKLFVNAIVMWYHISLQSLHIALHAQYACVLFV